MKFISAWLLLALGTSFAQRVTFDRQREGSPGRDWTIAMTHDGGAPTWQIIADPSAPSKPNVIAQTSTDNTSGRFPLAIYERSVVMNGAVSVSFKPISGERDQAAGIVWRYKDPDNYYIVRANALEDNVVLYKVEGGKRISLEPKGTPSKTYGVKQKVPKQTWSTLRVEFQGPRFAVFINANRIMEVEDTTFSSGGKTGLWTKADSVTYFDDFRVEKRK
jgi:hypothetical protein